MTGPPIQRWRHPARIRAPANPAATRARRQRALTAAGRAALAALVAVGVAGFLVLLLGPIAQWATVDADNLTSKEKTDAVNATRQILLAATGGTTVVTGLAFTARTYYLSRRGQFTDRYTSAIAQLASDKLTERLGGIYALEHLMRESKADHVTVVDVLAAFIREHARMGLPVTREELGGASTPVSAEPTGQESAPKPPTDVQAALTVLARRPMRPEPEVWHLDLSDTDLRGADLRWARLDYVRMERTWLHHANLSGARLQGAFLRGAQLQQAWLVGARMKEADLIRAQLERANLGGADLQNALLGGVQLRQAHLRRADLRHAVMAGACLQGAYLVDAQLQGAYLAGSRSSTGDLGGAQFHGADLTGAQLHGAVFTTDQEPDELASAQGLTAAQLAAASLDQATMLPDDLRQALAEHRRGGQPIPQHDPGQ